MAAEGYGRLEAYLRAAEELGYVAHLERALEGRPGVRDIVELYKAPLWLLGGIARAITDGITGRRVGYIVNMIMNYTNICVVGCTFCSFYRKPGAPDAYKLEAREAAGRVVDAWRRFRIRQVLFQGGVDPGIPIEYYEEAFRIIKEETRGEVAIHGLSVVELEWLARVNRMSLRELLARLIEAGLDSVPGAGAEILSDRVRKLISPIKSSADTWITTMETIMDMGIPISTTMMYGHLETLEERARHLLSLLDLQRRKKRIMSFITWNFEPGKSPLGESVPYPAGGTETLRNIAVARIVFRGEIRWIQAGWLTAGVPLGQASLEYGANDWGGTLYGEKVLPEAGVPLPTLVRGRIERLIRDAGYEPVERDNWYRPIAKAAVGA
ncbi:MAG: CofH family radical SAM protein [Desulfurococcales archaeon]|nr:CofH family radical SAM protein [Desulfurococcales archaeon]